MFSSTAELAAGKRIPQDRTATTILGKAKEFLSYDSEQPNSLFKFFGRLANRQSDVENDAVMSALMRGQTDTEISIGGFGKKQSLVLRAEKTASGEEGRYGLYRYGTQERVADHSKLMEAFTRFADRQYSYGTNKEVIRHTLDNKGIEQIINPFTQKSITSKEILSANDPARVNELLNSVDADITGLSRSKLDRETLDKLRIARSRLNPFSGITDFSEQSTMFQKSSSIVTRKDEFTSEIFRYLLERDAILTGDPMQGLGFRNWRIPASTGEEIFWGHTGFTGIALGIAPGRQSAALLLTNRLHAQGDPTPTEDLWQPFLHGFCAQIVI